MDAEARAEMFEAANRVLCEHGYAGLTVQQVVDKASVMSTVIHYHFGTKEELLNTFLNDLIERFESELSCESADPWTRLSTVLDTVFNPRNPEADGSPATIMGLKARVPYHELFRGHLLDFDGVMREVAADIVRGGVAGGEFDETSPEKIARFIATMGSGVRAHVVALSKYLTETRRIIEDALELHLGWTPDEGTDG